MKGTNGRTQVVERIKIDHLSNQDSAQVSRLPTQEQLARQYGVSRSTIVKALSQLTIEGYIQSHQGSGTFAAPSTVKPQASKTIAVVVPELQPTIIVASCRGVERRARQLGYSVLLSSSGYNLANEQGLVEQHIRDGVKGVIVYPVTRFRRELADDYLIRLDYNAPIVAMDIACDEWNCSKVVHDNFRAGYDMTQALIRHGHKNIAFMHALEERLHSSIHQRCSGWRAGLAEANIIPPASYLDWPTAVADFGCAPGPEAYDAIARSILDLSPRPDAVIAWTDEAAVHMIDALEALGIRIPAELRVTGFDNSPMVSRLFRPLFPTTDPNFVRLGELSVDCLVSMADNLFTGYRSYYCSVPVMWRDEAVAWRHNAVSNDRTQPLARA